MTSRKYPAATLALGKPRLTATEVDNVARGRATVLIDPTAMMRMKSSYDFVCELARSSEPVYGLTTGCGPLAEHPVSSEQREAFQRNLIRSHATTLGAPHSTETVRAAMTVRAHVLARGLSGVDPALVGLLADMLNLRIHPIVREVGGCGASGDLPELAQIALAAIGEGSVEFAGSLMPASQALRAAALKPLVPRGREGLALINGTSFHTGAAALLLCGACRLLVAAEAAAAMSFDALHGHAEALDPALEEHRPHVGHARVAAHLRSLLAASKLVRSHSTAADSQDAYTLRCVSQVLGAIAGQIESAAAVIETELNSVTDNPLFLCEQYRVIHGGNFRGQPVAMALDQLKLAVAEIAVFSERRIARLLDSRLSHGLPPFLVIAGAGVQSGFMGLQYCASSTIADNAVLVSPASVNSVPTNANNQDLVSMGMVAARQAARILDNTRRVLAIELLAAAQALEIRGTKDAGRGCRAILALVRERSAFVDRDRPLSEDVEMICELIEENPLEALLEAQL